MLPLARRPLHSRFGLFWTIGAALVLVTAVRAAEIPSVQDWRALKTVEGPVEVEPGSAYRLGFEVPAGAAGQRVVAVFRGLRHSDSGLPAGYNHPLALEVNGELLTPRGPDAPRLLNRPPTFIIADGRRISYSREGEYKPFQDYGSIRWCLPFASDFESLLADEKYAPQNREDPFLLAVDISNLVRPGGHNFVDFKNEAVKGSALRLTDVSIRVGGEYTRPAESARVEVLLDDLRELYLGRSGRPCWQSAGRGWAYNMYLGHHYGHNGDSHTELRTLEEARRRMQVLKDRGFTDVIMNGQHFRLDHQGIFEDRMLPYFKLLTQAAHELGMRVINHHDPTIVFLKGYRYLIRDGQASWLQRDVRYGLPARMMCLNNPDYRRFYFEHLRRVQREADFDAYMLDEVTFQNSMFCACEHCRRQFKIDTGLELPEDPWDPAIDNDASPLWQLFQSWKGICIHRFRRDALAALHSVDPEVFLFGYGSTMAFPTGVGNYWAQLFDTYASGVEAMSGVPYYTYRATLTDLLLRRAAAEAFGGSGWALLYPKSDSQTRFSWAMAQAVGLAQWVHDALPVEPVPQWMKWGRTMDNTRARKRGEVAVVFSKDSRDYSFRNGFFHGFEAFGWCGALLRHNVQFTWVLEELLRPEDLDRYEVVVLANAAVLDEKSRGIYRRFVRRGGTLLVTGRTGLFDADGRPRAEFALSDLMGVRFAGQFRPVPFRLEIPGREPVEFDHEHCLYRHGMRLLVVEPEDAAEVRGWFVKDGLRYPAVIENRVGEGRVITLAAMPGIHNFEGPNLRGGWTQIYRYNPAAEEFMAEFVRGLLGAGERDVTVDWPEKVLALSWEYPNTGERLVHVLNLQDHQRYVGGPIRPDEEYQFPRVERPLQVYLRDYRAASAELVLPAAEAVPCEVRRDGQGTRVTIPGGSIEMYGMLRVQPEEN